MDHMDDLGELRRKVKVLEDRIQGLRTSRRILMNLVAAQEREKRARIQRLERENHRLQKRSSQYARAMMERNIRIIRLEESLRRSTEDIS